MCSSLSGGLKPPLSISYFQVKWSSHEEDAELSQPDWTIQTFALNFCFTPIAFVLSHMNQVPLILQTNALGWLVSEVSFKHWDLGSIPRSPYILHNFVQYAFRCNSLPRVHHASNTLACHMSQEMNLKARIWNPPWTSVKRSTRIIEKSKKAKNQWAKMLPIHLHLGQSPPMFVFFSLFILPFIYFNYINYIFF